MKKVIDVVGAIIIKDKKILCAQRGREKSLALKWEFPGGKIEAGETPQLALEREIREELASSIAVTEKFEETVYEYDFGIVHLTTFLCQLIEGVPKLTEHQEVRWVEPNQLAALDWAPADLPAVKKLGVLKL